MDVSFFDRRLDCCVKFTVMICMLTSCTEGHMAARMLNLHCVENKIVLNDGQLLHWLKMFLSDSGV